MTAAFVFMCVACNPTTDRPEWGPLPRALVDTVPGTPADVARLIGQQLEVAGLPVRRISEIDGFVETHRFDIETRERAGRSATSPDRRVIMRFWVDAIPGERVRITAESAHRLLSDPSLDERLAEMMAGPEHPGRTLLRELLDALHEPGR